MKNPKSTDRNISESDLPKINFVQYLNVLFPLIEGDSDQEKTRVLLKDYLEKNEVPAEIEDMFKDLFQTKFKKMF